MRDAEAIERAIDARREKNARLYTAIRVGGAAAWVGLEVAEDLSLGDLSIATNLVTAGYLLAAIVLFALARRRRTRELTWYAVALVDIPAVFFVQVLSLRSSSQPWVTAMVGYGGFALFIASSMMALRRRSLVISAAMAIALDWTLLHLGGAAPSSASSTPSISRCSPFSASSCPASCTASSAAPSPTNSPTSASAVTSRRRCSRRSPAPPRLPESSAS